MLHNMKQWWDNIPSKGGLIGALLGLLASTRSLNPGDRPLKNAGKTALYSGTGFLLGQWLEKITRKQ